MFLVHNFTLLPVRGRPKLAVRIDGLGSNAKASLLYL